MAVVHEVEEMLVALVLGPALGSDLKRHRPARSQSLPAHSPRWFPPRETRDSS